MSPSSACIQLHSRIVLARCAHSLVRQHVGLELGQRRRRPRAGPCRPRPRRCARAPGRHCTRTLFLKFDLGRLGRHVDAGAGHVELPAVVDAAQAVFLVAPEEQRGAAVRAGVLRRRRPCRTWRGRRSGSRPADARAAAGSRARQLVRAQRRYPVLAHQVAHRRAGADATQHFVVWMLSMAVISLSSVYAAILNLLENECAIMSMSLGDDRIRQGTADPDCKPRWSSPS